METEDLQEKLTTVLQQIEAAERQAVQHTQRAQELRQQVLQGRGYAQALQDLIDPQAAPQAPETETEAAD